MARKKAYRFGQPSGVANVVQTVCADYQRRGEVIRKKNAPCAVRTVYVYINEKIDSSLGVIEEGTRLQMLADIGMGRGYDFSPLSLVMAKNTYYKRKRATVEEIARSLNLI